MTTEAGGPLGRGVISASERGPSYPGSPPNLVSIFPSFTISQVINICFVLGLGLVGEVPILVADLKVPII